MSTTLEWETVEYADGWFQRARVGDVTVTVALDPPLRSAQRRNRRRSFGFHVSREVPESERLERRDGICHENMQYGLAFRSLESARQAAEESLRKSGHLVADLSIDALSAPLDAKAASACGSTSTRSGAPCQHRVGPDVRRCPAGHLVPQ